MKLIKKHVSTTTKVELCSPIESLARCYIRENHGKQTVTMFRVYVPKALRGKGYGSKLLEQVCDHYKDYNIRIGVSSSGPLSDKQLIEWYMRYDFILVTKKTMVRAKKS